MYVYFIYKFLTQKSTHKLNVKHTHNFIFYGNNIIFKYIKQINNQYNFIYDFFEENLKNNF